MRNVGNRVLVFDTTLRDGEQAPGFSMGVREKLRVAHALKAMGVDIIEAGFAAASPGDAAAVREVASEVTGPVICSLARALPADLVAAARALEPAKKKRVHIFLGTSPIHRKAKFNMTRDEVLKTAVDSVTFARSLFDDVEFSAEDAIRTELDFLIEVLQAVADAGANTLNVPDTVGYATPAEMVKLFKTLAWSVRRQPHVRLSTHCHNDLGMAVANSLAAVEAGARQVECTMNGIGERAGNCSLEEFVMALRTRRDLFGVDTAIDTTKLAPTSRLVSRVTRSPVVRNKAVVGRNAFAHEAGIHQHGMMNDARTYEVMRPQDVGVDATQLVLGKHSGKHAVGKRARELGFELGDNALADAFVAFKERADDIGEVDDAELRTILTHGHCGEAGWKLTRIETRVEGAGRGRAVALVELTHAGGEAVSHVAIGSTAMEAALAALRQATGCELALDEIETVQTGFGVEADATAEVWLTVDGQSRRGRGRGPDPMWAAVRASVDAVNKSARDVSVQTQATVEPEARYEVAR